MSKATLHISSCGHVTYEYNTASNYANGLVYYCRDQILCTGTADVSSSASGNGADSWVSLDADKSGGGNASKKSGDWMSYATYNDEE